MISYPPIPAIELAGLSLSLHGLASGTGLAVGSWVVIRAARRRGWDGRTVLVTLAWTMAGAFVGSRLVPAVVAALAGSPDWGRLIPPGGSHGMLGAIVGGVGAAALFLHHQRPITVIALEGSVYDAQYPATVGGSPVNVGTQVLEATVNALSKAMPDKAIAGWGAAGVTTSPASIPAPRNATCRRLQMPTVAPERCGGTMVSRAR